MEKIEKDKFRLGRHITGIFVLILLTIFPLYVHNQYFDILKSKYMFFYITVIAMTTLTLLSLLFRRRSAGNEDVGVRGLRLSAPDITVICFWGASTISTVLSGYFYESFWGNEGRFFGLFLITVCTVMYFVVSRGITFSHIYINAFLIAAVLVCLWGISDFFNLDVFGFRKGLDWGDKPNFTSSFGNINTYTAYVAFVIGIAGTMFIAAPKGKQLIWYTFCMIISFFAIIMGLSDNAYLALGALFAFIPFYAFRTKSGAKRYLLMCTIFATVIQCIAWICVVFKEQVVQISGLFNVLTEFHGLVVIVLSLWFVCMLVYYLDRNRDEAGWKTLKPYFYGGWILLILLAVAAVLVLLYDANTTDNPQKYGSLSHYLVFDDAWGTHRLFNWRLGVENYKSFSPVHKIFGYGPETYGIVTVNNNITEMTSMFNEKYDNAHNEYLQYFVTIGPVGLAAYLGILVSSGVYIVKRAIDNPYVAALLFAVICYAAQAVVNIAVPMTTPFIWLFLAMGVAACRKTDLRTYHEKQ